MADNERIYFTFFKSYFEAIEALNDDDQKLQLYRAICEYSIYGREPELEGTAKAVFIAFKPNLDSSRTKSENGKKGGAPIGNKNALKTTKNQPKNNQNQPKNNQLELEIEVEDRNRIRNIPPISPKGETRERFEKFYSSYPKHKSRKAAEKAFEKIDPDDELLADMLKAIENQKRSEQWTKNNGQFIPYPSSWLNGHMWEDETEQTNTVGERFTNPDYYENQQW